MWWRAARSIPTQSRRGWRSVWLRYKQLGDVVRCEAIPKTPSGKILRRVLRAQDAQRTTA